MCALRTQNELKFTNRLGGEPSSAFLLGSGSRGVADIMFAFFKGSDPPSHISASALTVSPVACMQIVEKIFARTAFLTPVC